MYKAAVFAYSFFNQFPMFPETQLGRIINRASACAPAVARPRAQLLVWLYFGLGNVGGFLFHSTLLAL